MRATYRETPTSAPVPVIVVKLHRRSVICREVDRLLPGVFAAARRQVVLDTKRRWVGKALEAMRQDFELRPLTLPQIAERNGTSVGVVSNQARLHNWVRHVDRRNKRGRLPKVAA